MVVSRQQDMSLHSHATAGRLEAIDKLLSVLTLIVGSVFGLQAAAAASASQLSPCCVAVPKLARFYSSTPFPCPTAGDQQLFEAAGPLLDVMGKAKFFLGEVGAGANMKLVVNMVRRASNKGWAG